MVMGKTGRLVASMSVGILRTVVLLCGGGKMVDKLLNTCWVTEMRTRRGSTQLAEAYIPVDHFPGVLKHFSEERLVETTCLYAQAVDEGRADAYTRERSVTCRHECERRGIRFSRLKGCKQTLAA